MPLARRPVRGSIIRSTDSPLEADALMLRLASGEIVAFEMFYDAYHRLVYGIGLRLLGEDASAEDLTQGVFLKVWMNPAAFKGGNLVAWIGRVARNAALDVLRQRSARAEGEIPANVTLDGALEDEVFANLDAERVRTALLRLPATERIPIEMGFFDGKTYRSVAHEIGVPVGTVKSRIRTGLHRLRDALSE
jgi:RNA polymerase sigma-70 factor, ECF subfamily